MSKADTSYQGWPNRATWNVALWIGNDEPIYSAAVRFARSVGKRQLTADKAREFCQDVFPNGTPDIRDLRSVRYGAIAQMMRELA